MPAIRQIHLAGFLIAGNGAHSHALWRHPLTEPGGFLTARYYQEVAGSLERGLFDLVFFADRLAISSRYDGGDAGLRYGDQDATRLDPLPVLGVMSASTRHIGLGATRSTTYARPYSLAREFATLDHLSAGRAAWNVVTSVNQGEADNFGVVNRLGHDERYDAATSSWGSPSRSGTAGPPPRWCSTARAGSTPTPRRFGPSTSRGATSARADRSTSPARPRAGR